MLDPIAAAKAEAEYIAKYRAIHVEGAVDRVVADAPFLDSESLLAGLEAFHAERMTKAPSATKYPESVEWVDFIIARDREIQAITGLTHRQMAVFRSLHEYLCYRGYAAAKPVQLERCRIIYLPETEMGEFHIKNVDDPITFWKPIVGAPNYDVQVTGLAMDGVGSGLHMDDEPEEIFPLPALGMVKHYCDDVPGAVDFLTRYCPFWGGGNLVLYDTLKRNAAIEKCSRNFIEVFWPGVNGGNHCSGLACRNPQSPLGQYQAKKRLEYLQQFNQPLDGPDMTYWKACDLAEQMLGDLMKQPKPTVAEILELFTAPWPKGLNKPGTKMHPGQAVGEYTLVTHCEFYEKKLMHVWQRDAFGNYPCAPEVYQF